MEKIKLWIADFNSKSKIAVVSALIAGITIALSSSNENDPLANEPKENEIHADTAIPPGFVLVNVILENSEFIDSVLGPYGKVDLYSRSPTQPQKLKKVATKIRLLRAPKNPNVFAILSPESKSSFFVRNSGPYMALIHNPNQPGTNIEIDVPSKKTQQISYETGREELE